MGGRKRPGRQTAARQFLGKVLHPGADDDVADLLRALDPADLPEGPLRAIGRAARQVLDGGERPDPLNVSELAKLDGVSPSEVSALTDEAGDPTRRDALRLLKVLQRDRLPAEAHGGERGEDTSSPGEDPLAELNEKHFCVLHGDKVRVATLGRDPVTLRPSLVYLTADDFRNLYLHRRVVIPGREPGDPDKTKPLGRWWLEHPLRRSHEGVTFSPGRPAPEGWYNAWTGWGVEPRPGPTELYWDHVLHVVCRGRADVYQWLRKWLAHGIQRPWEVPGTAVVLRGKQGTGKGMFVDPWLELFGHHALTVYSMEHLAGRFAGHLENLLALHANEATWGGDRTLDGVLKGLVTDRNAFVERKHVDGRQTRNYLRVIVSTNHDYPVARDPDDRRFLVLDVSDAAKEDANYFRALAAWRDSGGLSALLHDLQAEPLQGFNPREAPVADGWDIKIRGASSFTQWWHECLQEGFTVKACESDTGWNPEPEIQKLHRAFLDWCDRHNRRTRETQEDMGRLLRRLHPWLKRKRPRFGGDRCCVYVLGTLAECRKAFEIHLKETERIWEREVEE